MDGARSRVRRRPHPVGVAPGGVTGRRRIRHRPGALTLRLVAAARSAPNRSLRFGAESSALDDRGRRDAEGLCDLLDPRPAEVLCGPELSVVQTADALGAGVVTVAELRSIDLGSWVGCLPEEVPTAELAVWFGDPTATPHGGESVVDFLARLARWVSHSPELAGPRASDPPVLVVAKPVVQALVAQRGPAGAAGFFAVDIRPASVHVVPTAASL